MGGLPIGNWNYACKSHYFITKNKVVEAGQLDAKKITAIQRRDRRDMEHYVAVVNARAGQTPEKTPKKSLMHEVVAFLKKVWRT